MSIVSKEVGSLEELNPEAKMFKYNLLCALLGSPFHSSTDSSLVSPWARRNRALPEALKILEREMGEGLQIHKSPMLAALRSLAKSLLMTLISHDIINTSPLWQL